MSVILKTFYFFQGKILHPFWQEEEPARLKGAERKKGNFNPKNV
jgi:hypothetical protein